MPYSIYKRLWGDRKQYGLVKDTDDREWKIWLENSYSDFYVNTQNRGIGNKVCNLAYPVITQLNFNSKKVLEIGPGRIRHFKYMKRKPLEYMICDIEKICLEISYQQLIRRGINCQKILLNEKNTISFPFSDNTFDIILSFNSLEHFQPLNQYIKEIYRILKPNGYFAGGIPCEGGLAWGLGRFFTTRRYVSKNYKINYDKIICWEHPNFADKIYKHLDSSFQRLDKKYHPFSFLPMDLNLISSFIYKKI